MADSVFAGSLEFLEKLGLFDVVLPFLLTFAIVFAMLEKTKILGTQKIGDKEYPKKNLNSIVSFCISFFVIASSQLVAIISDVVSKAVLLIFMSVLFLLLIGSFFRKDEEVFLDGAWRKWFMVAMLVGLLMIFANALPAGNGKSWLEWLWWQITENFSSTGTSVLVLLGVFFLIIFFIIRDGDDGAKSTDKKKEGK